MTSATSRQGQESLNVTPRARLSLVVDRCPMEPSTDRAVERWAGWMRAAELSTGTIALRTGHVRKVLRDLDVDDLRDVTTEQLVAFLAQQRWRPNTKRSYRASLRTFFDWARATGLVDRSPVDLVPRIKPPRSVPRPIPDEAYRAAKAAAKYDRRLRCGIWLGGQCGLRRFEIAKVHSDDVVEDLTGHSLRVVGKGGHERMVPLPDDLAAELLALPKGWLFPSPRIPGAHSTAPAVGRWISSVLGPGYTTHSLRHRCGTKALENNGGQLRPVQELLGHAHPNTTAIYTGVSTQRIRSSMEGAA